jgi:hypothetical protein
MDESPLSAQARRQRVVALTANTHQHPQRYERELLASFDLGGITLAQVEQQMAERVYQLLYHSQIRRMLSENEMQALLEWSRRYNAAHGITGLLLYSEGYFVQVLEGSEAEVHDLFARIQHDTRHQLVTVISQGLGPRRFGDWHMRYALAPIGEVTQTIAAIQTKWPWGTMITNPYLKTLLTFFS